MILEGDCVEQMREMDEASVDAIVTDPPYGLEFMGKEWDRLWDTHGGDGSHAAETNRERRGWDGYGRRPNYIAGLAAQEWHQAWATEALRILKPGGHLLAFGGTRTYHRLACAIEDAGFEIRDSVIWLYGSGFPKSLDVSKAIDKAASTPCLNCDGSGVHPDDKALGCDNCDGTGFVCSACKGTGELTAQGERPQDEAEIRCRKCGGRGRVERDVVGTRPRFPDGGRGAKPGTKASFGGGEYEEFGAEVPVTAPATPEAAQWEGWGTALKPAHEPIVVARKPLSGTVAANVLEHGTGALNIDGCRIGTDEIETGINANMQGGNYGNADGRGSGKSTVHSGRWPANVALSHLPECEQVGTRRVRSGTAHRTESGGNTFGGDNPKPPMEDLTYADPDGTEQVAAWRCAPGCPVAALDEQSGEQKSPATYRRSTAAPDGHTPTQARSMTECERCGNAGEVWAGGVCLCRKCRLKTTVDERTIHPGYGDSGGASRFFYTAKASKSERSAGLPEGQRNSHPTVKALDLMRWLVRLVTPPGGTVLDPFVGSGTTGCAAVLEGFDFIGIEREAEYVEIAKARIAWWSQHEGDTDEILRKAGQSERIRREHEERGQLGLEAA